MSRWQSHSGLILASAATKRHGRLIYITGGNDDCVAIWDASALEQLESQILKSQNDQLLSSLSKLVSFRTVSSDPSYAEDCRRGATYLKQLFKRYGATATLLPSEEGRNPIVHARFGGCGTKGRSKGKTILFYGHYDVISASESAKAGWQTRPFELTGVNGYLYGRGVSDNKGPCLAALFAAGELVQEQELGADITFLIEGEEESGSRGFVDAVRRNKELIGDVDWILLANSYWLDDDVPCLTYGLRGVIHATVVVESDKPDLHSGVEGSRLNREPTIDLVNLLAKLTSPDGKVLIPGEIPFCEYAGVFVNYIVHRILRARPPYHPRRRRNVHRHHRRHCRQTRLVPPIRGPDKGPSDVKMALPIANNPQSLRLGPIKRDHHPPRGVGFNIPPHCPRPGAICNKRPISLVPAQRVLLVRQLQQAQHHHRPRSGALAGRPRERRL